MKLTPAKSDVLAARPSARCCDAISSPAIFSLISRYLRRIMRLSTVARDSTVLAIVGCFIALTFRDRKRRTTTVKGTKASSSHWSTESFAVAARVVRRTSP